MSDDIVCEKVARSFRVSTGFNIERVSSFEFYVFLMDRKLAANTSNVFDALNLHKIWFLFSL